MQDKIERKRLAILRILKDANETVGSQKITELLEAARHDISERTVRFHLNAMDKDGLTECIGRQEDYRQGVDGAFQSPCIREGGVSGGQNRRNVLQHEL
jgi:DNA-binding transcriptional ArsR family regulator